MALTKISGSILKDPLNLGEVSIGGTLTYQDVTNVDSIGLGTFRSGINVSGGQLDVGSNIKLGNAGVITATSFVGSGANLTNLPDTDSITEGNSYAEVLDTGTNGIFRFVSEGNERLRITHDAKVGINTNNPSAPLEIQGNNGVNDASLYFTRHGSPANNSVIGQLLFRKGTDSVAVIEALRESANDDAYIRMLTQPTGGNVTERLRITSAGRIGIGGATSPEELLDLGNALQINLKVGGRAYLGQGYSTAATILGHSVKAKTTGTVSGGMEVTETNSGGGAPAAMRMQSGRIEFHTAASGTSGATFDSEKVRITSEGALLLSTAGTRRNTKGSSQYQAFLIEGTTNNTSRMSMIRSSNDDNGPEIQIIKTRGTSVGSVTKPNQNDYLGAFVFLAGDDSDLFTRGAEIGVQATGTPANDRCPSDIIFSTTPTSGASTPQQRLRIASDGNIGINQTSPQALLHIGNYETGQNVQQSTVTQYFIDSTRSLKIARQSAGNVTTNAAWYTVATLALNGYSYRCQVSLGGNFTNDVVDIDIQTAYSASLNNKYSFQMNGKVAAAHSSNRITRARVTTGGLLQVWINNGVDSNTTAKVVLETTCGIYAQNGADNAYPMPIVVDSSSPSIITHHLLNFGVHSQWTWTINSSSVRSYTRLSGEEFCGQVNAGNGSNQGVNNTFNAPMDGLYHCDFSVAAISSSGNNNCLISMYGSMTYNTQNNVQNNDEVYDPRGCGAATQPQQGSGFSTVFKMAKGDYFTFDFYRPGGGNGYTDGGGQVFDICVHKIQ